MTTFRSAVEAGDLDAATSLLADDVVFRSPVAHRPYEGRPVVEMILRAVFEVFVDFHYVREFRSDDGEVLVFEATVDGLDIAGADFITFDADGRITDFTVMVRPLRAAQALAARMADAVGARLKAGAPPDAPAPS
ncbi:nuclear transport factor 2 family protein [Jatrophihabitans fulvus]